ncbi:MAG TPA: T9SS type A sorting domain-containing protein [candidate division Zixibacteria bacterium]|nr:T9SS type A sorting domain-containing protein [candidate division Zixibacteria bacterium]
MRIAIITAIIAIAVISATAGASPKIAPGLLASSKDSLMVWVFFEDKPLDGMSIAAVARLTLSERALERRAKDGLELDIHDVPVNTRYIEQVVALGARHRRTSRWLNSASFITPKAALHNIAELPFVREIRPVRTYRRPIEPVSLMRPSEVDSVDDFYGASRAQLEMIGAIDLHQRGFAGQGVLVGMLDSGFRTTHRAFDSLDIVAVYDFVHNDTTVDFDPDAGDIDEMGFRHGTQTLSCVAAFSPGEIIGAAYRASVALAKTEDIEAEYRGEEDNWVAGIEWLDSLGADIASSSLGYSTFDEETPYTMNDLDGNTMVTTIAADIAASRGICVVNSAGNYRQQPDWPTIISPADGDSVLAVAAVGHDKVIASFSSPGPSADGRIKPDISAVGWGTVIVNAYANAGIAWSSGTSFSCPLIAGLCAAVKSANHELSGYDLALAVRASGDRVRAFDPTFPADSADNDYGWGIPKGTVAAGLTMGFYGRAVDILSGEVIPNKEIHFIYDDTTIISATDTFGIFVDPLAMAGQSVALYMPGYPEAISFTVDGAGRAVRFGRYRDGETELLVFPNPASEYLRAVAYAGQNAHFSVFTASGELVFDERWSLADKFEIVWPLKNGKGTPIANGIYIVRLVTEHGSITEKIAVVR